MGEATFRLRHSALAYTWFYSYFTWSALATGWRRHQLAQQKYPVFHSWEISDKWNVQI